MRQGSTLLDYFIQRKGCKVEQISPLFYLYLYLFLKIRRASILFYANLACQVLYTDIYCTQSRAHDVGSRGGEIDLSDFVVAFKFIYCKYMKPYTRERLLLARSAKQSGGKGVSRSQLQCQATTALRKNSVHLNRAGVIEINVCERQGR